MRSLALLVIVLAPLAPPAFAQTAPLAPEAHALPFASEGNEITLAIGGSSGGETVAVASAPTWVRFEGRTVAPEASGGDDEPVARVRFDVAPEAPIGDAAEIVLEVRDGSGAALISKAVRIVVAAPEALELSAPRPNPSHGAVVVPFALPGEADVWLTIHDALGREVSVLAEGARRAGGHAARLEAGALASGVYVVRLVVDGPEGREARVQRLTVVR